MREIKFRAWLPRCSKMEYKIEKDGDLDDILSDDGSNYVVMQYTGLQDKNGKEIYEGDIVKDNVVFGAVVFDEHYAQFMIDDVNDEHQEYTDWWQGVEVIGNIYENPKMITDVN